MSRYGSPGPPCSPSYLVSYLVVPLPTPSLCVDAEATGDHLYPHARPRFHDAAESVSGVTGVRHHVGGRMLDDKLLLVLWLAVLFILHFDFPRLVSHFARHTVVFFDTRLSS